MRINHSKLGGTSTGTTTRWPDIITRNFHLHGSLSVACLAVLLYGNTISHGYVLDDAIVITQNAFTQQGIKGIPDILANDTFVGFFGEKKELVAGGRYRPLSVLTFAVEYEVFGSNPHVGHLINILLYAITGVIMLRVLIRFLGQQESYSPWLGIPFIATLLFIAHPIHTEVVANIKSRDEIICLLFALLSLDFAGEYVRSGRRMSLVFLAVVFLLSLLSKENAIVFIVVIPVLLVVFLRARKKDVLWVAFIMGIIATGFIALRWQIVGGLGSTTQITEILNNAYIHATLSQKYATIAFVLGKYFVLSLVPHPLSHDYYFNQIPLVEWSDPMTLLSAALYVALGMYVMFRLWKKDIGALGIFIYLIGLSIVSNIVVPVGTSMAERFAYLPSLGICIAWGWSLHKIAPFLSSRLRIQRNMILAVMVVLITGAYSVKTIARNPAWKDNFSLFQADVGTSPNSAKIRNAIGGELVIEALKLKDTAKKKEMLTEAIKHLSRAVEIYPGYSDAWSWLGNAYYERDEAADKAIEFYERSIALGVTDITVYKNLGVVYKHTGQHNKAIQAFRALVGNDKLRAGAYYDIGMSYLDMGLVDSALTNFHRSAAIDSTDPNVYNQLGIVYGRNQGNIDASVKWMEKAVALGIANYDIYQNLGIAYATKNNYPQAIENLKRAVQENPNNFQAYSNLALVYQQMGDTVMAKELQKKSEEVRGAQN